MRQQLRAGLVVVAVSMLAGACSSGHAESAGVSHPTSTLSGVSAATTVNAGSPTTIPTTTSPTTTPMTTTTVDPTQAAILGAYRASWADTFAVEGHYPVNEFDPILANHMAGNELNRVRNYATLLNHLNEYLAGPMPDTSGAIVKQQVGSAAVVADCEPDHSVLMNGKTGQVVRPAGTQPALVNAKVELIGGTWKVTDFSTVRSVCTSAN
jgi:hypothetical protein